MAQQEIDLETGIKAKVVNLAQEQGITARYASDVMSDPITGDYRIMLMSPSAIPEACLPALGAIIAELDLGITVIQRSLAADEDPASGIHALGIFCKGQLKDLKAAQQHFQGIANEFAIDVVLQDAVSIDHDYKLVCFDMDSTLIQVEVIDELAKVHGVGDQVAAITARAMRGELEFSGSFRERVALLNGLDSAVMQGIAESLPLMHGAARLCEQLGKRGIKLAILSGGFTFFGHHLQKLLGLDYVVANQLEIKDGVCTGKHLGEIIDASAKARNLLRICEEIGINSADAIAIGDGANDLEMIGTAGLGIAFHAKPLVREKAPQHGERHRPRCATAFAVIYSGISSLRSFNWPPTPRT